MAQVWAGTPRGSRPKRRRRLRDLIAQLDWLGCGLVLFAPVVDAFPCGAGRFLQGPRRRRRAHGLVPPRTRARGGWPQKKTAKNWSLEASALIAPPCSLPPQTSKALVSRSPFCNLRLGNLSIARCSPGAKRLNINRGPVGEPKTVRPLLSSPPPTFFSHHFCHFNHATAHSSLPDPLCTLPIASKSSKSTKLPKFRKITPLTT